MSLVIKSDPKFLVNKMMSQFSKSGYDDRWINIEVKIQDNSLYLIGGGVGIVIITKLETEGTAPDFTGQIDLRRFFETVKFMGKNVEIDCGLNVVLKKNDKNVQFSVQDASYDRMLPIKIKDLVGSTTGTKMEIYQEYYTNLIEFVSDDELRPSLTGIYLSHDKGKTSYVATDGFHLLEIHTKMPKIAPILINIGIPFVFDEDIYVQSTEKYILYQSKNWWVYQSIFAENTYPNYRKVLDGMIGKWRTFAVNRKDMIFILKSAMGFAGGKMSAAMTMTIDGDLISLTSKNKFNDDPDFYSDKIAIKNMDKIKGQFSVFTKYLLDGITASSEDEIMVNLTERDEIFISENDRRILVLPMKT